MQDTISAVVVVIVIGALLFFGVVCYVGRSVQIMNPPPPDLTKTVQRDGDTVTVRWSGSYDVDQDGQLHPSKRQPFSN